MALFAITCQAAFAWLQGLKETIDQLASANSARWYGQRREVGHILGRALDFEVEGQGKKGKLKMTWKKQVDEESMKVGLRRKDALCRSKWSDGVNKIVVALRFISKKIRTK